MVESIGNFEVISAGTALQNPGLLFEKIEDEEVQMHSRQINSNKSSDGISFKIGASLEGDSRLLMILPKWIFALVEIVAAEKMEKSKKLIEDSSK